MATSEALVNSMPESVKALLENNGGHTNYSHFGPNLDILYSLLLPVVQTLMSVSSYFEGTVTLHYYTSCTLTTLCRSAISSVWSHEKMLKKNI